MREGTKVRLILVVWLLVAACVLTCVSGCHVGFGIGADADLYYPSMTTAAGGSFGDPDSSRAESTVHTTSVSRKTLPMVGGE